MEGSLFSTKPILVSVVAMVAMVKIGYWLQSGVCKSKKMMVGKTVIITGASAGIGKEAALDLAKRGARVILACRNLQKAQKVADEIRRKTGNNDVHVRQLDTSDLTSVRTFAQQILNEEPNIHVLINNAGIIGPSVKHITSDGLETTMATNHFGHFLLTNLLLDRIKSTKPSRIVNVSSRAQFGCKQFDPNDLDFHCINYSPYVAYSQSKLCNIMFTQELAQRLRGSGVTANSLHPGLVSTDIVWKLERSFTQFLVVAIFWIFGKSAALGAQTIIYLSVDKEVNEITGKYFVDCKEAAVCELAARPGLAKELWKASEQMVMMK